MTARRRALEIPLVALSLMVSACGDDDDGGEDADIGEVSEALGGEVRATLATMLHENPGSRDFYLEATRENHPDVWQEVTADGDVTLAEFRSMPHVQDAVNHYGAQVLQSFRDQMVAAADG